MTTYPTTRSTLQEKPAPFSLKPLATKTLPSRERLAWFLLTPTLAILCLVAGWPLLRTLYFSFCEADLLNLSQAHWIGLGNYQALFEDENWWTSVRNTVWFTLVSVSFETILGLVFALMLNQHFKGRGLLRAAVLIPWAIPTIVSAKMWGWMYHDIYGILNEALLALGLIERGLAWTADHALSLWAVVLTDVWKTTPFMALLLLAGLQTIPHECYESAKIDGVSPIKVFFRITLPLLMPALCVAVLFRSLDALRIFDLIFVLTANTTDTMSISVFARQQIFDFQDIGLGSAASAFLFFMISAFVCLFFIVTRKHNHDT